MGNYIVSVIIENKPGISDPEGDTILNDLVLKGENKNIKEIRAGTILKFSVTEKNENSAKQKIMNSTIISYADIIFEENILKKLLNTQDEISLVNDRKWLEYWNIRPDETSDEATETVYVDQKNCVRFIGKKIQDSNAHFIGLMKLQNSGTQKFLESFEILKK